MKTEYRPDIDGLRAVAVLLVVGFHAFPGLHAFSGGFVGVDVFFVISGFLISGIILDGVASGTFSYSEFYARRIRRIFPALLTVLSASMICGWFWLLADDYQDLGRHVAAGAAFAANFDLMSGRGYFGMDSNHLPELHLWSLGIEEQFYILWPLLLARIVRRPQAMPPLLAFLLLASLALNLLQTERGTLLSFYSPLTRFWELLCGAQLALYGRRTRMSGEFDHSRRRLARNLISLAGLAMIGIAVLNFNRDSPYPGWRAMLPVAGAAMLIGAGSGSIVSRLLLSRRPMVAIGLISYPLYLWHWPILSFQNIICDAEPSRVLRLAAVTGSVVLAALTYQFVERPLRIPKRASARPLVALSLGASMALVAVAALVVYFQHGFMTRFPPQIAYLTNYPRTFDATPQFRVAYRYQDRKSVV